MEKKLGREASDTFCATAFLGRIFQEQGKLEAAEEMSRQALERSEKVLGRENRITLAVVWDLAILGHKRKEYTRADALFRRARSGYEKTLGAEHPDTIKCAKAYAGFLERVGDITKSANSSGKTTTSGPAAVQGQNGSTEEVLRDD